MDIEISRVRLDGGTQPRASIFEETLSTYIEDMANGAAFPAVVLFFDGSDYWLADGFHRFHAAKALGKDTLLADVRQGTQRDAVLFSVGANADHGRPRTNEDKRRAVRRLLDDAEWAHWSDREIARACRVDHKTVSALRPAPAVRSVTGEIPSEFQPRSYTTKHGSQAVMNTANIGRPAQASTPYSPPASVLAPTPRALDGGLETFACTECCELHAIPVFVCGNCGLRNDRRPRPAADVSNFNARMAEDGPLFDAIKAIVDAFAPLPSAAETARRFPRGLRHAFSANQARFISDWFADLAVAWEQENGEVHVAAE